MKKYVIKEINSDGYERFVIVNEINQEATLIAHFLECDEYLEVGEMTQKRRIGDVLEGNLSIGLVSNSYKDNEKLFHRQNIINSPHIEAIVEVLQIVDKYSLYALSSIVDDKILIEFESAMNYKVGERVFLSGELEMSEK